MKAILVIDLPQTCTACPITSVCATDGRKAIEIVRCGGAEKRMDFCPLKPIPNEACQRLVEGLDAIEKMKSVEVRVVRRTE